MDRQRSNLTVNWFGVRNMVAHSIIRSGDVVTVANPVARKYDVYVYEGGLHVDTARADNLAGAMVSHMGFVAQYGAAHERV